MQSNLAHKEEPREEIIGGKAVMPASPSIRHTFIAGNIYSIFHAFLRGKRCVPIQDGAMVRLNADERYIPDMMVVCDPEKIGEREVSGAPDLVVEVLSPGTAKSDRTHKKASYERYGVREYWIVSPGDLSVEQYILKDGAFLLREIYHKYTKNELEDMTPAERAAVVTEFKCSLFDDLAIHVDDIFDRVAAG